MPPSVTVAIAAILVVSVTMLAEMRLSRVHERALRARGAVEPDDDVYPLMAWSYPLMFLAMAVEGAWAGPPSSPVMIAGIAVFAAAKALKYWAMTALGRRWTFRVLVPPDAPLVTRGPYAWLRHPNYVAVIGELAGIALLVGAPFAGTASVMAFSLLIRRRIVIEERALGIAPRV